MSRDFNPFGSVAGASKLAHVRTPWLLLTLPLLLTVLCAVTLVEGTFGSISQIRPLDDLRLILGQTGIGSPPDFPLMRDFLTLWLVGAIALTVTIVHRQWQLMAVCVRDLERSGAIRPLPSARPSRWLDLGERFFSGPDDGGRDADPLEAVMRHARAYVAAIRSGSAFLLLLAVCCAVGIAFAERTELFTELAPPSLTAGDGATSWINHAYDSWWANLDQPAGAVTYMALAAAGVYLVLIQNAIGLVCAYFVLTLPSVAEMNADWLNRDGLYGWRPIALVFRTVYWSLLLHGVTLALIVVTLGPSHVLAVVPLLLIWLLATPIYIGNSIFAFRRVERAARDARLQAIESRMVFHGVSATSPSTSLAPYLLEIDRVVCAKIRPLSLGKARESVVFSAFILPLALTAVQMAAA